jgi:hypothetical protein
MPELCFCILCDLWLTLCTRVHSGRGMLMHHFLCSGVPGAGPTRRMTGHITLNLCFTHLVQYAGHVVHSGASGERDIDALFSMLGGPSVDPTRSTPEHVTPNMSFHIRCNLWVT